MKRVVFRGSQAGIDLMILALAFVLAFGLRFDWSIPAPMYGRMISMLPYVVAIQYLMLLSTGVNRLSWRYVGLRDLGRIVGAVLASTSILLAVRFGLVDVLTGAAQDAILPVGVILIDFGAAFIGVSGVRVLRRVQAERASAHRHRDGGAKRHRTLLIGAGQAGVVVAREVLAHPELGVVPVGFLDDDPLKVGTLVGGVPVLGPTADIERHCERHDVSSALITISNAPGQAVRRIVRLCERAGITPKIIPNVHEIVAGKVNLTRIRDVDIEDLLRRDAVELDIEDIRGVVAGKTVVVTGAGGSIGSELCRQLCRFEPGKLVLVEQAENALFEIHSELIKSFPSLELVPAIADVCDEERVRGLFEELSPSVVLHAAAHKHVPMMEWNAGEAVKNNVFGTKTLADAACEFGVERFVMISTDKAVNPSSVMGATKRVAEIYIQALSSRSDTIFSTVRFGNVLGSAGSVIPIFKRQIAEGGPVTVTHPDMQRYFMTIPEACQLVIQASTLGAGSEIFILDMGEAVRIRDLAEDLITLSGFRPGDDIEISYTGVRPGEKLFEELSVDAEHADQTAHPKIFVGRPRDYSWEALEPELARLARAAADADDAGVRACLRDVVPEYVTPLDEPARPETEPSVEAVAGDTGLSVPLHRVAGA